MINSKVLSIILGGGQGSRLALLSRMVERSSWHPPPLKFQRYLNGLKLGKYPHLLLSPSSHHENHSNIGTHRKIRTLVTNH